MPSDPDDDFEDIDDSDSDSGNLRANVPTSKDLLFVRKPAAGTVSARAGESEKSGWTCSACTFENQCTAVRCEICATTKPQAAAVQTNIAPIFLRAKPITKPITKGIGGAPASTGVHKHVASDEKACNGARPAPGRKSAPSSFGAAHRHPGTDAHKQLRPRATALRKAPTLREKVRAMHSSSSAAPASGFAAATPLPLPTPSLTTSVLKYRLPFFKSIAQLKAEGIAPFDFDHLFSAGASRVMLRTSEGCECGPKSTCSKVCPCRKVGKLCDPSLCKCSLVCCKNTKENALLEAAKNSNMGHWITRNGQRVYFDKDGNEYTGSAAMRRYQGDKKGDPPPRKRKRKKQRRPRSRGRKKNR